MRVVTAGHGLIQVHVLRLDDLIGRAEVEFKITRPPSCLRVIVFMGLASFQWSRHQRTSDPFPWQSRAPTSPTGAAAGQR